MLAVWDSQNVENTFDPRATAIVATSPISRLLPMPGGPTTQTTRPAPPMPRSSIPVSAVDFPACARRAPLRGGLARPAPIAEQTTGRHRFVGALDVHQLGIAQYSAFSTNRAVDSLSITPPGGATDSIRWAMPTCSPIAV